MEITPFFTWFANCCAKQVTTQPVVLLLDGHDSNVDVRTGIFAQENNIYLYALLPHTSHLTQPLDVAFLPFEKQLEKVCQEFIDKTRCSVSKSTFASIFMNACMQQNSQA